MEFCVLRRIFWQDVYHRMLFRMNFVSDVILCFNLVAAGACDVEGSIFEASERLV